MRVILDDTSTFLRLALVETHDCTTSIEAKSQRQLFKWVMRGLLSPEIDWID